jgi:hypothetical protein
MALSGPRMTDASVHSFGDHEEPARRLAALMGSSWREITVRGFPDEESLVRISPGKGAAVVYCPLDHPNGRRVNLLLAASALRDAGADSVVRSTVSLLYEAGRGLPSGGGRQSKGGGRGCSRAPSTELSSSTLICIVLLTSIASSQYLSRNLALRRFLASPSLATIQVRM